MLAALGRFIHRRRLPVIGAWVLLVAFGAFGAQKMSKRWFQQFSIPGYSAYETNQKVVHTFGSGEAPPEVLVFHSSGDVTKERGIQAAVLAAQRAAPGSRSSSTFSTGSNAYASPDRHTPSTEICRQGLHGIAAWYPAQQIL